MGVVVYTVAQAWSEAWAPALAAGALTVVATRRVLGWLRRRQIMDLPNERSSHTLPTPRGGGLATTPVLLLMLLAVGFRVYDLPALGLLPWAALLALVSWVDDRQNLSPAPRFLAQTVAVAAPILFMTVTIGDQRLVFDGAFPLWLDRLLAGLGWLWFVNLYNFMDGIDGITGVETATLGLGLAVVATLGATWLEAIPVGMTIAAVGLAFLAFNWHPAKLFLGDSGSVPFGYVLGGLLLWLALAGQLAAALILPAYYLADATITLVRRALAGDRVWQAHRKHFYQRAVQGGKRHDQVVLAIAAANLLLIGCAVLTVLGLLWQGVAGAVVVTSGLLALLQHWSRGKPA